MTILGSQIVMAGDNSQFWPLPSAVAPGTIGAPQLIDTLSLTNLGQTEAYVAIGPSGLLADDTGTAVAVGAAVSISLTPGVDVAFAAVAPGGVTALAVAVGN